jgi:ceramide glucosyltransferase
MDWTAAIAAFALLLAIGHFVSLACALLRCRRTTRMPPPENAPRVSIVRPVCGTENNLEATLRSGFRLDYPDYEIVFCIALPDDPAAPLVRRLIAEHPRVRAVLLLGNERINDNPKLNNVAKGWRAAASDWIVMADSNVLMPPDYIQRLLSAWRADTGAVCSPAVGGHPVGFAAELECAFLNTYAVRWQYMADSIGFGFAQGKNMLLRRDLFARQGGIRALAIDLAEDAAVTKVVRAEGLRVRLTDAPFLQPLGRRRAVEVWRRQLRWARLRRSSFKHWFALEILTGGLLPMAALTVLVAAGTVTPAAALACVIAWYAGEAALARAAGWPLSWSSPVAWALRDLLLPALWAGAWLDSRFVWRGNAMQVLQTRKTA